MSTAKRIYDEVCKLPEKHAREVLDFVEHLKGRRSLDVQDRRKAALATLLKYRGRFKAVKFSRDELYGRQDVR